MNREYRYSNTDIDDTSSHKDNSLNELSENGKHPFSNTGVTAGFRLDGSDGSGMAIADNAVFETYAIDYLTITTYDKIHMNIMRELFYEYAVKPYSPTKLMQYDAMQSYDKRLVSGTGYQRASNGERHLHGILKASGAIANTIYRETMDYDFKCTRIDLQTTPYTSEIDYEILYNYLRNYTNCTIIKSNTPTVYVGSRKSDRFVRIYQHRYNDVQIYDRFEVEYKSSRAQLVFDNPSQHAGYLLAEIYRLSRYVPDGTLDAFVSQLAGITPEQAVTARKDNDKGIDFYLKVVSPYLRRVINNPEFKAVIRYDLEQLDLFS